MHLPTMLFRPGTETEIWGISLDTITVDAKEVPDYLAAGWYSHPWEARDSVGANAKLKALGVTINEHVKAGPAPVIQATPELKESMEALYKSVSDSLPQAEKPRRGRPPKAKETP